MPRRQAPAIAQAAAQLDELLARSLELSVRQQQPEVSEALLCALEAHARATGDSTRLDAVYLRMATGWPSDRCAGATRPASVGTDHQH
jgi:hypothetical protein